MKMLKCQNCNAPLNPNGQGNIVYCDYCCTPHYLEDNIDFKKTSNLVWLANAIYEYFSMEELNVVCNEVYDTWGKMNWDDILGQSKMLKCQETVKHALRHGCIKEFIITASKFNAGFAFAVDNKQG